MEKSVLSGKGHRFENIPRDRWEKHVMLESQHMPAVLDFMTKEHHLVRNLVVKEIARKGKPVSPEEISVTLGIPKSKIIALLDDLERNLFFLVRDDAGKVTWAFPVTTEKTPHQMTFNTGEKIHAAWAVDAIATPFVQGRLRNEVISAEIETVCAQSSRPLVITLDSKMKFRIKQKQAEPLVFSPQVDWASFSEPNIIQSFWQRSVFFWSEEQAKDHRTETKPVDGIYMTLDQAVYAIPIFQSALFAFK